MAPNLPLNTDLPVVSPSNPMVHFIATYYLLLILILPAKSLTMPPRRILVTGANTGIGLALTKQLIKDNGCYVYLGSRNAEKGKKAVDEVKRDAGDSVELLNIVSSAICFPYIVLPSTSYAILTKQHVTIQDVSNLKSIQSAATSLSQSLGTSKLDAIVNNAGTGFAHGTSPSEIFDINTRGPRRVIDAFLPLLSPQGRIVNVGSGAGPMFFDMLETDQKKKYVAPMEEGEIEKEIGRIESMGDGFAAYAGSKALLGCYTMDLAKKNPELMVSIITPGFIKTSMTAGMGANKSPEEGTVSIRKCLFEDLPSSGYFWGSDGLRSPFHCGRNPGEPEFDGVVDL